ncbi:hypothetical protein HanIR_Chr08g0384921 [Helianthus annuus]|nr:hypothetical protein HanIR_Chr08g0384921 [Helianthus annuus]
MDSKIVMQVQHFVWKFRGNCTISVDGLPVELYWDVHNWLFGSSTGSPIFFEHVWVLRNVWVLRKVARLLQIGRWLIRTSVLIVRVFV